MVPIHESDLAAERWSKAEWENYELWEKVEHRLRRQKRFWIFATAFLFVVLSAVPIAMERWPKWTTRYLARHLAQEINRIKRESSIDRTAYRLKFVGEGNLTFVVERVANCSAAQGEVVRTTSLVKDSLKSEYAWLSTAKAGELGIPGLVGEFCYDFLLGSSAAAGGEDSVAGVGIISVNDLAQKRLDRLTLLLFSGKSAELSFD